MRFYYLVLAATLSILSGFGILFVGFNDDLSSLFQSSDPSVAQLERLYESFPSDETDFLIILQAEDILEADNLRTLRELDLVLRSHDSFKEVISLFDARKTKAVNGYYGLIFPDNEGSDEKFKQAKKNALAHPLLTGSLISNDSTTTIFIVRSSRLSRKISDLDNTFQLINSILDQHLKNSDIKSYLGGLPALRIESLNSSKRDQVRFTLIGGFLGILACWLILKRLRLLMVVVIPPLVGVLWILGFFGLFGENFNVLNTILPILLIIIGFTDSLHMLFAILKCRIEGISIEEASRLGREEVGPACILTSLTTAIAFASLYFTQTELIQNFGIACAAGVILNLLAVLIFVPELCILILSKLPTEDIAFLCERKPSFIKRLSSNLAKFVGKRSIPLGFIGLCLTLGLVVGSTFLKPDYSFYENLPTDGNAYESVRLSEEKFGGTIPIRILVEWSDHKKLDESRRSSFLRKITEFLSSDRQITNVMSLERLEGLYRDSSSGKGIQSPLLGRLLNEERRQTVLSFFVSELPSSEKIRKFREIRIFLKGLENEYPEFESVLTGISVVSTEQSSRMIGDLAKSLGFAAIVIFFVISLSSRSILLGLLALIPNIFPLVATASILVLFGISLQYSSVIVFTVALGLAVDDTIHYLARFQRELQSQTSVENAIAKTSEEIGVVIVITTIILALGMMSIVVSSVPTLRLFGLLSCATIIFALIGDLIFLPASLNLFVRKRIKSLDES